MKDIAIAYDHSRSTRQGRLIDYSGTSMMDHTYKYKDAQSPGCMADEQGERDQQHVCEKLFKRMKGSLISIQHWRESIQAGAGTSPWL